MTDKESCTDGDWWEEQGRVTDMESSCSDADSWGEKGNATDMDSFSSGAHSSDECGHATDLELDVSNEEVLSTAVGVSPGTPQLRVSLPRLAKQGINRYEQREEQGSVTDMELDLSNIEPVSAAFAHSTATHQLRVSLPRLSKQAILRHEQASIASSVPELTDGDISMTRLLEEQRRQKYLGITLHPSIPQLVTPPHDRYLELESRPAHTTKRE